MSIAEVVESELRNPGGLRPTGEPRRDPGRLQRPAVLPGEDPSAILVLVAPSDPLFNFERHPGDESIDGPIVEVDSASPPVGLRRSLRHSAPDAHTLSLHRNRLGAEVDRIPAESHDFPAAHPRHGRDPPHRVEAILTDRSEERRQFVGRPRDHVVIGLGLGMCLVRRVARDQPILDRILEGTVQSVVDPVNRPRGQGGQRCVEGLDRCRVEILEPPIAERAAEEIPGADFMSMVDRDHYGAHIQQLDEVVEAVLRMLRANS